MKKKFPLIILGILVVNILLLLPCHGNLVCDGPSMTYFQYPSLWVILAVPLSLFAITLNDQKHKVWLKFTGIFFVISIILVFLTPEYGSGIVSIDRELMNWFLAGLYAFISIIYFIIQFVKSKRTN